MDAGDFIYIIIAVLLAAVNAVANKKKKAAGKGHTVQPPPPEEELTDPADILKEILMGRGTVAREETPQQEADRYAEDSPTEEATVTTPEIPAEPPAWRQWGYEVQQEAAESIEYEHRYEDVSEAELYSAPDAAPLDSPENASFSAIDTPIAAEDSIEGYSYETLPAEGDDGDELPSMIFDHERALEMQRVATSIADEFDARKAVIFSEVLRAKYI